MYKRIATPITHPVIGIDIDGTIWEDDCFPYTGTPYPYAIQTINALVEEGYEVVIWTSRSKYPMINAIGALIHRHGMTDEVVVNDHSKTYIELYGDSSRDGDWSPKASFDIYFENTAWGAPDYEFEWEKIHWSLLGRAPDKEYDDIIDMDEEMELMIFPNNAHVEMPFILQGTREQLVWYLDSEANYLEVLEEDEDRIRGND